MESFGKFPISCSTGGFIRAPSSSYKTVAQFQQFYDPNSKGKNSFHALAATVRQVPGSLARANSN